MRRITINLFVAILTFAIGIIASALLKSATSSSASTTRREVVVEQRAEAIPKSEAISTTCGCYQDSGTGDPGAIRESRDPSKTPIRGGILNSRAINLPRPAYPPIAKAAQASGTVTVRIVVDERGCIESARVVSGHPLLQQAALQAARQACFAPTLLSGQPVKVTGDIIYNFLVEDKSAR